MADGISFKDRWERLKARQENESERQHEIIATGLDVALANASGAAVAFMHGRRGGMPAIARMPIDAVISGVANLAGFGLMMTGRMWGRHVVAIGTGPSVWWLGGLAAKWGQEIRKKKGEMLSPDGGRVDMTAKQQEDAGVQYRQPIVAGRGEVRAVY